MARDQEPLSTTADEDFIKRRERQRNLALVGAIAIAVLMAFLGFFSYGQSREVGRQAATATHALGQAEQRGTAVAEEAARAEAAASSEAIARQTAVAGEAQAKATADAEAEARQTAEEAERLANARALTAFASSEIGQPSDPSGSLALLLAREAVLAYLDHDLPLAPEADAALRLAVDGASAYQMTLPRHYHSGPVNSAAYSPDGGFIVTASDDLTARVWDAGTGEEVRSLVGHSAPVNSAAYSPDGGFIVTASGDNSARVWDAGTGEEVHFLGHSAPVNSAAYSPDGGFIVTASEDRTARVWIARIEDLLALAESLIQREPPTFTPEERQRFLGE